MSPIRTPPHSPSSRSFFLSSPRNATASSPRNSVRGGGGVAESNMLKSTKKKVLDANEPVGSCDATTRLHAAVALNWPGSFEEHVNQMIKRSVRSSVWERENFHNHFPQTIRTSLHSYHLYTRVLRISFTFVIEHRYSR
jgi:hypothetical protein